MHLLELVQGSTIALRTYNNGAGTWLSCYETFCDANSCGGLFFEGSDWNDCPEGVFEIYHSTGVYYNIQVGEQVGLYSPSQQGWLSLYQNYGHAESCPGKPDLDTGFHRADSWYYCGAEIFMIYAKGKVDGEIITENDVIQLYFPLTSSYVNVDNSNFDPVYGATCPDLYPPPSDESYEDCPYATFQVAAR